MKYIESKSGVASGHPVIKGTRIRVATFSSFALTVSVWKRCTSGIHGCLHRISEELSTRHSSTLTALFMSKSFHKHKLLFDEGMPPRRWYTRLNEHFDVKHIAHDFNMAGADDVDIYQLACKQKRIIVTINRDDFADLVGTREDAGAISVPDGHNAARVDSKLTSLLMRKTPNFFQGRLIALGGKEAAS